MFYKNILYWLLPTDGAASWCTLRLCSSIDSRSLNFSLQMSHWKDFDRRVPKNPRTPSNGGTGFKNLWMFYSYTGLPSDVYFLTLLPVAGGWLDSFCWVSVLCGSFFFLNLSRNPIACISSA